MHPPTTLAALLDAHPELGGLAVFAVSLAAYVRTLAPTVYTFDSAELAAGAYTLGIVHASGYPLYLLLGKLFTYLPLGDVAYRVNLMSALFAALSLPALYHVLLRLDVRPGLALAAALFFGFGVPLWSEAVVAEVYTLQMFLLAVGLGLLLRWRERGRSSDLAGFGLAYGLCFANHLSAGLLGPGLGLLIADRLRRGASRLRDVAIAAPLVLVGPLFYIYLPLRVAADPAVNYAQALGVDLTTPGGVWWLVSGRMFAHAAFGYAPGEIPLEVLRFVGQFWADLLGVGLIVGALGIVRLYRQDRPLTVALGLMAGLHALFFINYRVTDKATMFLPTYLIWMLFVASGYEELLEMVRRAGLNPRSRAWPVYAVAGAAVGAALVVNGPRVDLSGERVARQYAETVLAEVDADAFVVGDWVSITPLMYLQAVEGQRPDVELFDLGLYSLGRSARLRAEGVPTEMAAGIVRHEMRGIVAGALVERPVYALGRYEVLDAYDLVDLGGFYRLMAPFD
jgi:hypothetical protein